jgi:hypothetical protein
VLAAHRTARETPSISNQGAVPPKAVASQGHTAESRWLALTLLLLALLAQLPGLLLPPETYDEGLTLLGADRIAHGEVPYRDFWNTHSPGQITVVALLFRLFGPSIMVARAFDITVRAILIVLLFLLARRGCPTPIALLVGLAGVLALASSQLFGYTVFGAICLSLASLFLTLRALDSNGAETRKWRGFVTAGMAAGLALLFRHDIGAAGMLAAATTLLIARVEVSPGAGAAYPVLRSRIRHLALLAAGITGVVVPVAVLILALGTPPTRLAEIFITYPVLIYPKMRALPLPTQIARLLVRVLPFATALLTLVLGRFCLRRATPGRQPILTLMSLATFVVFAAPLTFIRADSTHQFAMRIPTFAILPGLWCTLTDALRSRRALSLLGPLALAPFMWGPVVQSIGTARGIAGFWQRGTSHGISRASGIPLDPDQVRAIQAVRSMVPPAAPLFVGSTRHDRVRSNDALFYFLAERRCSTYYHNLLPGLVTTERVQREMIAELAHASTPVLVLRSAEGFVVEPNESSVSSGVTLLDDYIRASYRLETTIGRYQIWTRK